MIQARGLSVRYPEAWALRDVDLSIAPGDFVLVGGPSGGGKSTLAHALMGLIPRALPADVSGTIAVAGLDPRQHGVARIATRVGLVSQNPATQLLADRVEDEVAFGPRNLGLTAEEVSARVERALGAVGCLHLRGRPVRRLSGGEQQRVVIAATLAMEPTVLILDEPAANLDARGVEMVVQSLWRLHRRLGVTVVVIEHRLRPFLPHADRLIWLEDGRVTADGPPEKVWGRVQGTVAPRLLSPPGTEPLVALDGVAAGYDGRAVLEGCSATVRRGDFVGLVGPNGAGKTTLARVLAGLLRPGDGRLTWHANGAPVRVGLLQQNLLHQMVCDTVEEEVRFGPENVGLGGTEDVARILAETDLLDLGGRSTRALSVGQQQRTALAACLGMRPALLILDEPTMGQDWGHLSRVMAFLAHLNRMGQTILLITHQRRLIDAYANRVWRLERGKIVEID